MLHRFEDLHLCFIQEGYRPGPPRILPRWAQEADAEICATALCPCGNTGLLYLPYHRDRAYRAILVCSACGTAEEF